jgi:hypothetical protein
MIQTDPLPAVRSFQAHLDIASVPPRRDRVLFVRRRSVDAPDEREMNVCDEKSPSKLTRL